MMTSENREGKMKLEERLYPGQGRCIYCIATNVTLKDEHIVSYFLGGNEILVGASCAQCEKITCKLDGYVANVMFSSFRHGIRLQSRTKIRPETKNTFISPSGERIVKLASCDDAPYSLVLPGYHRPGILDSRKKTGSIVPCSLITIVSNDYDERIKNIFSKENKVEWQVQTSINSNKFCRFIAKICLSSAVAKLEYDCSKSPLGDIILGNDKYISHYIGGIGPYRGPAFSKTNIVPYYTYEFAFMKERSVDGIDYLVCNFIPFKETNPFVYKVVIGEAPMGDLAAREPSSTRVIWRGGKGSTSSTNI